ncbi:feruloyl esterase [Variovorax sp. HW608]|nr:feruloyl esterase [Variovorax sp. HW608]
MQVEGAAAKCSALSGSSIPASALALPSQGATVTSAQLSPADASAGLPEFCKVLGSVIATDAADPKINFEVNLPTTWNFKALQLGGAGFNGVLITGISGPYGGVQNAPSDAKLPLAQSYVTFGSDGGTTPDGLFGTNAQAMANYSGESVKRTHDAANYLISAYYGTAPRRMYHIGGSKGGHESLQAAQKYGADYDGIVGYYPANQNQAMVLSWFRMWNAAYSVPGGALNAAKQDLVKSKVLEACDALDGVVDGIIGNTEACRATFAVNSLRCPAGADTGDTCLSDAQINTLMTGATPLEFAFPLSNGVTSIGPYPVLEAGDMMGILFDPYTTTGQYSLYYLSADPVIRTFIQQDPNSVTLGFDYRNWQSRVQQLSALLDATNPNLDAFKDRGGKFLLIQGTTDMLVSPYMTTAYYNRVVSRYGDSTGTFLRYYVQPGFGHGSGAFALKWDSLAAIDSWVESGQAPVDPVVKDGNAANGGRTRPLCEYPLFPKYKGSGDVNSASSFTCASA